MSSIGHRRRVLACLFACAPFVATGHASGGGSVPDEFSGRDTTQWFETVEPGQTIRVVNLFGDIYSRFGGYENQVEILATNQRLEADLPPLEVRFDRGDHGLDIIVGFVGGADETTETRDRIDLVVFVPAGASLEARTGAGLIDVKGLKGDVAASSLKGDLRIHLVQGRVSAKTTRGDITVTLATGATTERQDLSTETGDIEVWLGEDADMNVNLATSGEISTDFSLEIEHRRFEEPSKYAVAVVGRGGPELALRSKEGRVRLLRLQQPSKPAK